MNLLLDQGLPRQAATLLRARGWTVAHVGELGMARAPDREILAEAMHRDACVVTLDADFHTLLAISGAARPSVIRLRLQGIGPVSLVELLFRLWPQMAEAVSAGSMIAIDDRTIRIHRLPLTRRLPPEQTS